MNQQNQSSRWYISWIDLGELFIFLFVVGVGAYLRFYHLKTYPDWYNDEGVFINISDNLLHGRLRYFALNNSILLAGRPPLFFFLLAGVFSIFDVDIVVVRGLAAVCGVIAIVFTYILVREMTDRTTAFCSTLIMAIYPEIIAYNRIGFTYNLQMPLTVISVLCLWRYLQRRSWVWRSVASVLAGLAFASDYMGIVVVIVVIGVVVWVEKRAVIPTLLLAISPFVILLTFIFLRGPQQTLTDLVFSYLRSGNGILRQFANLVITSGEFIRQTGWLPIGLFGLLILPDRRAKMIVFSIACGSLLFIARLVQPYGQGYFYLIPLFPWLSFGCGILLKRLVFKVYIFSVNSVILIKERFVRYATASRHRFISGIKTTITLIVSIITVSPFVYMVFIDYQVFIIQSRLFQDMVKATHFNVGSSTALEAESLLQYLNSHVTSGDLVLASPQIAWNVHGKTADYLQLLAYQGVTAFALPPLEHSRFAYEVSTSSADYIVLDDLWRGWAVNVMPDLRGPIQEVTQWPQAYTFGEFTVFVNPRK